MTATAQLVSIIIPAHNVSDYIADTLASVLAQTYQNWEAIVVNDGSTDTAALEQTIAPFRERITYVYQDNRGAGAARNNGIAHAHGEWLAFLDGDDYWTAEYLERQLSELQTRNLDLIWCDGNFVGDTALIDKRLTDHSPCTGEVTLVRVIKGELNIPNSGTVVRRSCVLAVNCIDESIRRGQDFDLWVRLLHSGVVAGYHDAQMLRYRVRPGNLTGDAISTLDRELTVLAILRAKNFLRQPELAALDWRLKSLEAAREITLAKRSLIAKDYPQALARFRSAHLSMPQSKLRLVLLMFPLIAPLMRLWVLARTPPELR